MFSHELWPVVRNIGPIILRFAAIYMVGFSGALVIGLKPALLSGYVEYLGFAEEVGGYLIAIEMLGAVAGTIFVAARGYAMKRRRLVAAALFLLLVGNVASCFQSNLASLSILRLVTGLGEGVASGLFAATLARELRPDRQFGIFTVLILLISAWCYAVLPLLTQIMGLAGLFALLASLAVVAAILLPFFAAHSSIAAQNKESPATQSIHALSTSRLNLAQVAIGTMVFYLAVGGVWPYMGQIGLAFSLTDAEVASVFSGSQIWGAVGALFPLILANRFGRTLPIFAAIGIGCACLGALLLYYGEGFAFILSVQAFMFAWLVFFPYLMGLVSTLDPMGRLSSLVYTIQNIGFISGPILCALVFNWGGYRAVIWLGLIFFAVTLIVITPLALRLDMANQSFVRRTRFVRKPLNEENV